MAPTTTSCSLVPDYYCNDASPALVLGADKKASEPIDIDMVGQLKAREWRKRQKVKLRNCSSENDLQRCVAEATKEKARTRLAKGTELEVEEHRSYDLKAHNSTSVSVSVSDDESGSLRLSAECLTPTSTLDKGLASSTSSSPTNSLLLAPEVCFGTEHEREDSSSSSSSSSFSSSWYTVAEEEETVLLNRARQTVDFVDKQKRKMLSSKPRRVLRVWEAVSLLKRLKLSSKESVFENSLAVAELCRKQFPGERWLHVAGLLHNLGFVTVMKEFGSRPLWKVLGETFPVGCKFSEDISYSHYFSSNPDRRKKIFNSHVGAYKRGCGLDELRMSWSASEYLCTVLGMEKAKANHKLPKQAMFLLRYHKFYSLLLPGQHYHDFMTLEDEQNLQVLIEFNRIQFEASSPQSKQQEELEEEVDLEYYKDLVEEFFPNPLGFY